MTGAALPVCRAVGTAGGLARHSRASASKHGSDALVRYLHLFDAERIAVLRISLHEKGRKVRLQLEGRLEGPWVAEFRQAFEAANSARRAITVDLRAVTFIDEAGREALAAAHKSGADFRAGSPLISAWVDEIRK